MAPKKPIQTLSKSKLIAYRICPKRLWLELHRKDLIEVNAATQQTFSMGHQVGELAQQIYDPKGKGVLVDLPTLGVDAAVAMTQELLAQRQTIFEAGFRASGGMAFADVLLPITHNAAAAWQMVEVKASTSVKPYYVEDASIQHYVACQAGVNVAQVTLAHIDSTWVYPGGGQYQGLLKEADLTAEVQANAPQVKEWIAAALQVANLKEEPVRETGKHCTTPYRCNFIDYCKSHEPVAEYPIEWLPGLQKKSALEYVETNKVIDMRDLPDEMLTDSQKRVKNSTLTGAAYLDVKSSQLALADQGWPAFFLDFETISFAVPIWAGTRPFQQIPFQFSLHAVGQRGAIRHTAFLDVSGADPSEAFANALVKMCGDKGPVFVYNAPFERGQTHALAGRFKKLEQPLLRLAGRMVDLLPLTRDHYYHPDQQGSWSIKAVLPTIAPDLNYADLEGVQDGLMAQQHFLEAIAEQTQAERKTEIEQQLLQYCHLDTLAMVRLWQFLQGKT